MALIDEAVIKVQAGNGGNGCVSFRREAFIPLGGPNGGDGGRGGHVYIKATRDKSSLLDFKFQPKYQGGRGEHGMGKDMFGCAGDDLTLEVPQGTLVFDNETGELLFDLVDDQEVHILCKGGRGGRGNLSYKSSTNRAPKTATPGAIGEKRELRLELKLLADVGLVGLPNAGKSSFLSSVSRARPKVADYPFTTLEPALGFVSHKDRGWVIADLPGLIEAASEGAGLGHKFLRHVARNRVLLHLVDVSTDTDSIQKNIEIIRGELEAYDPALREREELLVFTKIDLLTPEELEQKKKELAERGFKGFFISSVAHHGVEALLDCLAEKSVSWKEPTAPTTDTVQ